MITAKSSSLRMGANILSQKLRAAFADGDRLTQPHNEPKI